MSTKKTIQINPELFKMSKTKKNKEKKEKKELTINPIVSPNNLKNKLLKRIKEHKTNELKNTSQSKSNGNVNANGSESYTDEFYGAIDYLSDLSKKKKQKTILNNKTLKNHSNSPVQTNDLSNAQHLVSLELPPELEAPVLQTNDIFKVNYKPNDEVPYGCLKNGHKKTYREWKQTTSMQQHPEISNMIRPPTPPKKNVGLETPNPMIGNVTQNNVNQNDIISREERLEKIKNKLRQIQDQETASKTKALDELNKIEVNMNSNKLKDLDDLPDFDETKSSIPDIEELIKNREEKIEKENPKMYLKKTVRRKFTLGKSDKLRRVSVLIKNKQTQKNIINVQKELKKTNITDIRKYLRQHGMIKVGTTCPPDILRKTFEAAMLTGEVSNTNKDILLHNFVNDTTTN
jgi:hypothetical protein